MARTKDLIPVRSSRFADDYDVYVDYGKGRPVKMNNNEATFIDVEQFLVGHRDQSKMISKKISNGIMEINRPNGNQSSNKINHTHEQSLPYKSIHYSISHQYDQENTNRHSHHEYHSTFTPHLSDEDLLSSSSSSKSRLQSNIIYDETWLSNKQYNTRVTAFMDQLHDKFNSKTECTYPTSTEEVIHERIYPRRKLILNIAVNGASKSMRGQLPISNFNLDNGDFGDDAGMFVENRDFCIVGKYEIKSEDLVLVYTGLADGAGGNRSLGINPADFSQAILSACRNTFHKNTFQSNQLSRLITSAIQQVQSSKIQGSSTLCLLAFDKQEHVLTSLNIGDSGFVIYRHNQIYHRSTCTMNSDGCGPRQLYALDASFGLPCLMNENGIQEDCSVDNVKVEKNDIIILSSDGLWDVIKADQLQKIMERNANKPLQNLADDLLNKAVDGYTVNNRDDILIIVCRVDEA